MVRPTPGVTRWAEMSGNPGCHTGAPELLERACADGEVVDLPRRHITMKLFRADVDPTLFLNMGCYLRVDFHNDR